MEPICPHTLHHGPATDRYRNHTLTRRTVNVHEYERSTGLVQAHQRSAVEGPNTRWLLPEQEPPAQLLAPMNQPTVYVEPAFTSHENSGSEEYATPISRAQGQVIRLLPFSAVWLILTGGMVWLLGLSFPFLLVGFAILTAATYLVMNRDEFEYSRNGLERHKVNAALEVRLLQMQQDHELKQKMMDAYLDIAKAHYLGNPDEPTR